MKTDLYHQKIYLIKRKPDFTKFGVIVKQNSRSKFFEEKGERLPSSVNLNENDIIYVFEKEYGIYAKGIVQKVDQPIKFSNFDQILTFYKKNKYSDTTWWFSIIEKLKEVQDKGKQNFIWFHRYEVVLSILSNVISLNNKGLEHLKKRGGQPTLIKNETVRWIETPIKKINKKISIKIPGELKYRIHFIFNQKIKTSFFYDIDHLIPQSVGGAGNIPENLVPIQLGLNRFKKNSIPRGLFLYVIENTKELDYLVKSGNWVKLKKDCKLILKEDIEIFTSQNSKDLATQIITLIHKIEDYNEIRKVYAFVMNYHYPYYLKLLKKINYPN